MAMASWTAAEELKRKIDLITEEFNMAITFHEVGKPMRNDEDLHDRMGRSHATLTFNAVNVALRREMLMALMRIWDKQSRGLGLASIVADLKRPDIIADLQPRRSMSDLIQKELFEFWNGKREEVIRLIEKYLDGGVSSSIRKELETLRNKRFAHRQVHEIEILPPLDADIETFYEDTAEIVERLLSVVKLTSYNTKDTAKIHRKCANHFWAGVRGERTEGHPHFRAPATVTKTFVDD